MLMASDGAWVANKVALITGVTGQDGAYLAQILLEKGYELHGIKRRASSLNSQRIDHFYQDPHADDLRFTMHYGDMTDTSNLIRILAQVRPDEIYNLAAQSHVRVSVDTPEYTLNCDGGGTLRLLEALRILGMNDSVRFYQASTSELFGKVAQTPQTEATPFHPRSPYGVAKLYSYWITKNYREAYGVFASNGILFNHESPLRGETFVTRKITRAAARIAAGLEEEVFLGNLDAKRDWGHAKEYAEGMWRILQHERADDFVLATGRSQSVREFLVMAFAFAGIELDFEGSECDEVGRCRRSGKVRVRIDPRYFRPAEVDVLLGDASKAKAELGWKAKISVKELCEEMVMADVYRAAEEKLQLLRGYVRPEAVVGNQSFLSWDRGRRKFHHDEVIS